jgi:oleate hydratase
MMPYITSQFMPRSPGDRPKVVPDGVTNLAFVGQYAEIPEDVVFTVEYSVRTAQTAVCRLADAECWPVPVYHGMRHPTVMLRALSTMYR